MISIQFSWKSVVPEVLIAASYETL